MSSSILYHGWGIRGYQHVRTLFVEGRIVFGIRRPKERLRCLECGAADVICRGTRLRFFRTLPIGAKQVGVSLEVQRIECHRCGCVRQDTIDFADPKKRYTRALERYALDLSRHMTIQDVAHHLNLSWDTIKAIQKRHLLKHYAKPRLKHLKVLAIDEIYLGKRDRYLTVVLDWQTGRVAYVGEGKGAEALEPFWVRLRASHAKVKAVAMDMSQAYVSAVSRNLPEATIVFDRFHVIKLYNEKLTKLRRQVQRDAEDTQQKEVLKGILWLVLKNPENLNPEKNEQQRLQDALDLNHPLAVAYYLKDDLRTLWEAPSKEAAAEQLDDWIARATASKIPILMDFAKTLAAHRSGILAYHDFPISTGPLEGINNKIKTLKRQAYGFRDRAFFKLKILALHETKYALIG